MICAECDLTGGPFEPAEAAYLVALHDELHHGQLRDLSRPVPLWPVNDAAPPHRAAS